MTLIDSLSTLAVLGYKREFARAVRYVTRHVRFDYNARVNVFEANIRLLGGLLSAHLLAVDPKLGLMRRPTAGGGGGDANAEAAAAASVFPGGGEGPLGESYDGGENEEYDNGLLLLAVDLGERLLRAFDHPSTPAAATEGGAGGDDDEDDGGEELRHVAAGSNLCACLLSWAVSYSCECCCTRLSAFCQGWVCLSACVFFLFCVSACFLPSFHSIISTGFFFF